MHALRFDISRPAALCSALLFSLVLHAKGTTIRGRVVDRETGQGIENVSVYINGKTLGTSTGESGSFSLEVGNTPFEIVFSHIAYEIRIAAMKSPEDLESELLIRLDRKLIPLEGTSVSARADREYYLNLFRQFFLGSTYKEFKVTILNDSVISFVNIGNKHFSALASGPLQIDMPLTGYRLLVDLKKFQLEMLPDSVTLHSSILGYFHYVPVEPERRGQRRKIARMRNEVYYNSRSHFLKALYEDRLGEEGYLLKGVPEDTGVVDVPDPPFRRSYTTDAFGNRVLHLSDFRCRKFHLQYFAMSGKRPVNLEEYSSGWESITRNEVRILGDEVFIYPSGRVPENSILIGGPMGLKGVAQSLPEDFFPSMQ